MYLTVSKDLTALASFINAKSPITDINTELKKDPNLSKQVAKLLGIKLAEEDMEAGAVSKAVAFLALLQALIGAVPGTAQEIKKQVDEDVIVAPADKSTLEMKGLVQFKDPNETAQVMLDQLEKLISEAKKDKNKVRTCANAIGHAQKAGIIDQKQVNDYLASIGIGFSA